MPVDFCLPAYPLLGAALIGAVTTVGWGIANAPASGLDTGEQQSGVFSRCLRRIWMVSTVLFAVVAHASMPAWALVGQEN